MTALNAQLRDSVGLRMRVTGDADGRPLLLVHPLAANLTFWDDFVAALGPRFRCVVYDQRGFGGSLAPSRPWTLDDHVRDIEWVREQAGLQRFAIMGNAVANIMALHYAHRHPARIDAVQAADAAHAGVR